MLMVVPSLGWLKIIYKIIKQSDTKRITDSFNLAYVCRYLPKFSYFHTQIFCCVTSILFFLSQLYKFTWLVPYLSATNFLEDPFLNIAKISSLYSSSFDFPAPLGLTSFTPAALRALRVSFVLLLSKLSVQRKVDKVRK